MNNKELLLKILDLVGGESNIVSATNCMTRLRLKLKDNSLAKIEELKKTEGVMGVVEDETLQVVVGPGKAKRMIDILVEETNIKATELDPKECETEDWEVNKAAIKGKQNHTKLKKALRTIGDIFVPMLPAIIAAGIFNGFGGLIENLIATGNLPTSDFWLTTQSLFALIGGSFLGYLAIYTGINAARQFGATEALGGMIGAMTIAPQIVNISEIFGLYNVESPLNSILTTGKGGIIGVIVGVYILAIVEKRVRKRVPEVLDLILTPLITLFILALLLIFIIMPISGVASDLLVNGLEVLIGSENMILRVISGYVLAALFLPMVLVGLHHGLIPIYAVQLEVLGGVSLFPVLAMAGAGQVGAAIAIYFKAKRVDNQYLKKVITGALPAGVLGIGEPLIYGVTLPMGKPFVTAGLGAGFGGAYVIATNVMANSWGPSGLTAAPLMQPDSIVNFIIGLVIAYIAGCIITALFISDEDVKKVG